MDNIVDLRFVGVCFFFFFFFKFIYYFYFFYIIKFGPAMDNEWAGFFLGSTYHFLFLKKFFSTILKFEEAQMD